MARKAPPLRFVGNFDVATEGKTLWEMACQLKNLGAGRVFRKTEWDLRWPTQPSYIKIIKAKPEMDPWLHRGKIWAEWVFRGRNQGVVEFGTDLNRADWKLVHKHEESELTGNSNTSPHYNLPSSFPLPPLQRFIARRNATKAGQPYNPDTDGRAHLQVCLDPQFEVYRNQIDQSDVEQKQSSAYKEVDRELFLDWYGDVLPTKVEVWSLGPACFEPRWAKRRTS